MFSLFFKVKTLHAILIITLPSYKNTTFIYATCLDFVATNNQSNLFSALEPVSLRDGVMGKKHARRTKFWNLKASHPRYCQSGATPPPQGVTNCYAMIVQTSVSRRKKRRPWQTFDEFSNANSQSKTIASAHELLRNALCPKSSRQNCRL